MHFYIILDNQFLIWSYPPSHILLGTKIDDFTHTNIKNIGGTFQSVTETQSSTTTIETHTLTHCLDAEQRRRYTDTVIMND